MAAVLHETPPRCFHHLRHPSAAVREPHARHVASVRRQHDEEWVFPATRHYRDAATGQVRRHHLHESVIQRAFHRDVSTTMIYTHVLNRGGRGVRSPLDGVSREQRRSYAVSAE
jgi:hypothetical protein